MSLMYSIGRDRDVSVFDFQYRDGQFYSPEGKKIDEPFVSGEVKSFDEGRQNSPLITTDEKSRSVSISFPARETLANIRINMENISSLSDCLKAVSQGEKCSWKAKAVNVYSGSGF